MSSRTAADPSRARKSSSNRRRRRNVFVVGLDDFHAADLRAIPDADRFRFHPLLRSDEVVYLDNYAIGEKIEKAERILREFGGPVDAIIGHWDFPVTSMVPILCAERGLRSPTLEAVVKCAHKYWSRLEQRKHAPECTPDFCAVDPFTDDPLVGVTLDFPFWLKPVKGYGSALGFRVDGEREFRRAIGIAREKIRRFGDPFNEILARVDLPAEVVAVDGNHMIAEQLVGGHEVAPEGYVQHGRFHAHGVVDMIRGANHKSFLGYRYPSTCSHRLRERILETAERVLLGIGFDDGCFNMEFFWDEDTDDLWIIEINPRISQSHSKLFELVDGMSNHEVAIHVALGDEPHFSHGSGPFEVATKFLYRKYGVRDAVCVKAPTPADLERLQKEQPHTTVRIAVEPAMRLSELKDQDAYSFVLASLEIGAGDVHELNGKYHRAVSLLPFAFDHVEEAS